MSPSRLTPKERVNFRLANQPVDRIPDIDYPVEFSAAVAALSPSIAANGNFEPSRILLQGSEEDVKQAVRQCTSVSKDNTFISAGCEVPRDTPMENLFAVSDTLWSLSI
jgi:uroporphyrinogen-III decarboxylase